MKKTFITIIALTAFTVAKAQQSPSQSGDPNAEIRIDTPDTSSANKSKIFTAVEQVPSFPGGIEAFFRFLQTNI
ncbi:MAG TPA: hypothetical protein VIM89_15185 [Mucilaginibacter sp.]